VAWSQGARLPVCCPGSVAAMRAHFQGLLRGRGGLGFRGDAGSPCLHLPRAGWDPLVFDIYSNGAVST